jgi:maltooligosyltrehalose trehalohydrolase
VTLLAPMPPLMFMGEEWGAREPFPFFCDFTGDLAQAVREGRRREFAQTYARRHDDVPDPLDERTVRRATLDWAARSRPERAARLALVRDLLAARKVHITPRLPQLETGHGAAQFSDGVLTARWRFRCGETLSLLANLSAQKQRRPSDFISGASVWGGAPPEQLPAWSVYFFMRAD